MEDLTFGEQVKIILGRKGMTIKQLAELIEEKTGKKMSRQNLTQRLGRDNFQEQDMRMIAGILECPFHLSIISADAQAQPRSTASLERAAAARTEAVERMTEEERADLTRQAETNVLAEETMEEPDAVPEVRPEAEAPVQAEAAEAAENMQMAPEAGMPAAAESAMEAAERNAAETNAAESNAAEIYAAPEPAAETPAEASDERDVTIGELYDMHQELEALEESAKAGEPVEEIKKELEKPKREGFLSGGFFLRRKKREKEKEKAQEVREVKSEIPEPSAEPVQAAEEPEAPETWEAPENWGAPQSDGQAVEEQDSWGMEDADGWGSAEPQTGFASETAPFYENSGYQEVPEQGNDDFEPVIVHEDAEEDAVVGDLNPYTGREYQSNSVRMHPTRIGYVQVYDRNIHKWTDMTEWAFLGLQERKKALLGKAYEPPIYLD